MFMISIMNVIASVCTALRCLKVNRPTRIKLKLVWNRKTYRSLSIPLYSNFSASILSKGSQIKRILCRTLFITGLIFVHTHIIWQRENNYKGPLFFLSSLQVTWMCGSIVRRYENFGFFSVFYNVKKQREGSVRTISSFDLMTVSDNLARHFFNVLLTVHLSIISVINQLNAQILVL